MNSQLWNHTFITWLVLLITLSGFSSLTLLHAQDLTTPSTQEESARMHLEPFTKAFKEITHIYSSYENGIPPSDEPGQLEALQQEIHRKTIQAIASQGLTVEDYNSISTAIENSPTLKEEFITIFYRIQ